MIIRVDKCITFGIKKSITKSAQCKPKLLINKELVRCVEIGDSFRKYFPSWLDLPISGTLSNIFFPHKKFGLNLHPTSAKYAQYQTILRNLLKSSPNEVMHTLWKEASASTNIQYDQKIF